MISAALRASPRSEFPNVLSFAADEKACSQSETVSNLTICE